MLARDSSSYRLEKNGNALQKEAKAYLDAMRGALHLPLLRRMASYDEADSDDGVARPDSGHRRPLLQR
jgi:hypothetical protein